MFISRHIYLLLLVFLPLISWAEFKMAEIGVDGLTCSACSQSVEMSLRKLDFVDSVRMDLSKTSGKVYFKKSSTVSIEKVAKAIIDAGFSVRFIHATFEFDGLQVSDKFCWIYENQHYHFMQVASKTLEGPIRIKFLGEKFLPRKDHKRWIPFLELAKADCFEVSSSYYVTL